MSWERIFQSPTKNVEEARVPNLTPSEAAGFRLQTEERVSREKHVHAEARERNEEDIKLREEMHSFGMIRCGFFDKETKLTLITPSKRQSINVPVMVQSGETWNPTLANEACLLEKDCNLWLFPHDAEIGADSVNQIVFNGFVIDEGEVFSARLTVTRGLIDSGAAITATLSLTLSGAIYKNGTAKFPVLGNPGIVSIPLSDLKFFK